MKDRKGRYEPGLLKKFVYLVAALCVSVLMLSVIFAGYYSKKFTDLFVKEIKWG
jgi:hypothetical protein